MTLSPTLTLREAGQSLWLDNITRKLLTSGTLKRYIDELAVTGLTSNPTIFDQAISKSTDYDAGIKQKIAAGMSGEQLFFELALEDLTQAADLFRPVHDATDGVDGFVSLEVSPLLAYDTASTIAQAKELHARAGRPNLFIKIPGTREGLPAIEEAIFAGVPINVTLLFSREHYVAAADAYMRGIERRIAAGLNPDVRSVASVFISRWDRAVAGKVPDELHDQLGIAIAKRTYHAYRDLLDSDRAQRLAERRRAPAAAAVGEHRHQGPAGLRHPLRQRARLAAHREHHAGGDADRLRQPRRDRPAAHAGRGRCRGGARPIRPRRRGRPRARRRAADRGRQGVRHLVERADGGHRVQERRAEEGELTVPASAPLLTRRPEWKALAEHYAKIKDVHLRTLFAEDPRRGERLTAEAAGLYLDYSKHRITDETLRLLLALAEAVDLRGRIDAMFRGDKINVTENRAVLHVALRAPSGQSIVVDGVNVVPEVHAVLDKMAAFAERVRSGAWTGHTGKRIRNVDQYRHRRLGPRPGHGLRGAPPLQRARA